MTPRLLKYTVTTSLSLKVSLSVIKAKTADESSFLIRGVLVASMDILYHSFSDLSRGFSKKMSFFDSFTKARLDSALFCMI